MEWNGVLKPVAKKPKNSFVAKRKDGTEVVIPQREPQDFVQYKDLPTWVRTAIVMVEILGMTRTEAAKRCGKAQKTLSGYINKSPAAQAWATELRGMTADPQKMAQMVINSNSLGVSLEYFAAYEKAVEAGDYSSVAKISQDLLDRAGVTKKKEKNDEKIHVTLNIAGSQGIDIPEISASYEEVTLDDEEFNVSSDVSDNWNPVAKPSL